jgi:predicted nucleic acid-binding protein
VKVTSLLDAGLFDWSAAVGHRQSTDIYLLALARARGGRLATFDRSIPLRAVKGATTKHLLVVGPAD